MIMTHCISTKNLISIGIAVFLMLGANIEKSAAIMAILLLLLSIYFLYTYKHIDVHRLDIFEKIWIYSIGIFNIIFLLSTYDGHKLYFNEIESINRFILALPVYFVIRRIGLNLNIVFFGATIGLILSGIYAGYQIYALDIDFARGIRSYCFWAIFYYSYDICYLFL